VRFTRCPRCAGREVGRISSDRYYCWGCCCEFQAARSGAAAALVGREAEAEDAGSWRIFDLDEEGTLMPVAAAPGGPAEPAEPQWPTDANGRVPPVADTSLPAATAGGASAEPGGIASGGQARGGIPSQSAAVPGRG
jgi:hypothetical protein